jgi:hypothetical protein
MGIIGRRFVSDFSFEVSIELPSGLAAKKPRGGKQDAVGGAVYTGRFCRPHPGGLS